jgi:phenylalanyl-tRNA synthetase alpha chain
MAIDEKVRKTLPELGITDAPSVEALFPGLRAQLEAECRTVYQQADDTEFARSAKALRDRWLGRKNGIISNIGENWLKPASRELKPFVGSEFNAFRQFVTEEIEKGIYTSHERIKMAHAEWATGRANPAELAPPGQSDHAARADSGRVKSLLPITDLTLPGNRHPLGSIHPVMQMQLEIEEIFLNLGFRIESGPEIESTYYNFDALNIPESHPSRDDWDTLYIDSKTVLRTHTSPVQIRSMEKYGAPLHIIIPGKCYRHDSPDASHSPMFHQIEGLAIASDITFADLKGTLDFFAKKLFGEKIRTRFQPSFFPFTEPSGEVSISCIFCGGEGCRVCKESGWIEVMGCGMVHPQVLRNGGIDPEKYSGWAFGLGIDRFAMMKYDINDIQLFFQSDVRFLRQF